MSKSTATLVFKSGAVVEIDVDSIEAGRNRMTGELTQAAWNTPDDAVRRLVSLDLSGIDAIIFNDHERAEGGSGD